MYCVILFTEILCFVLVILTDKFVETSLDDEIDARRSHVTPRKTGGDSPICQIRKPNIQLNLPDWQLSSAVEPAGDSPVEEAAPSEEQLWPPVANAYQDEQPVNESPVAAQQKSDISSQPIDWEQLGKPVPAVSPPSITKQVVEGDVYEAEEKTERNESAEDGSDSVVRRLVTTRRQLLPVTELTLENGVEVSRTTSDVVVAVHVDEIVSVLPAGIDDPHADGLERAVSVEEYQETLETGGTLTRRVTTTTVRRLPAPEISHKQPQHPAGVEVMQDGKRIKLLIECVVFVRRVCEKHSMYFSVFFSGSVHVSASSLL